MQGNSITLSFRETSQEGGLRPNKPLGDHELLGAAFKCFVQIAFPEAIRCLKRGNARMLPDKTEE